MSTIGTNAEDLILNADGSGSDIKFKSNGTEVGSISDGGVMTATSFAGSGANLTGVGVAGISSSADATAMTISASENLRVSDSNSNSDKARISTFQSNTQAGTSIGGTSLAMAMQHYGGANSVVQLGMGYIVNHPPAVIGYQVETASGNTKGDIFFATRDDTADIAPTERLRIKVDGRGLSQFTAKFWASANQSGTQSLRDSHNISSIVDHATGHSKFYFTNAMSDANYSVTHSGYRGNYSQTYTVSTTFVHIEVRNDGGGSEDAGYLTVVGFGD